MRLRSVIFSIGLHLAVMFGFSMGFFWSHQKDIIIPPPIMVEIVEIADKTQTTKQPEPTKPKETKRPKPAPVNENTQAAALPAEKTQPKPEPKEKKVETVEYAPPKPFKKPQPPKPKIVEKQPPKKDPEKEQPKKRENDDKDFASVLKNLALPGQDKSEKKTEPAETEQSQNIPLGTRITIAEEDALRRQFERCWNVPIGARDIENMIVEIRMSVNHDKTLRQAEIVNTGRYHKDSFFKAVADSALRAVYNPLCSPLALPDGKYESWKVITVNFNPKDMF